MTAVGCVRNKSGDDIRSDFTSVGQPLLLSWSKVDPVDHRYVVLEIHRAVENNPLSLAQGMVTSYQLVQALQMNMLYMVPHVRNAFEGTSPLFVCIPLIPDTEDALSLAQDEGDLVRLGRRIGSWSGGQRRLFLNRTLADHGRLRLAGLKLLSRSERRHGVDSKYLPGDNVLRLQVSCEMSAGVFISGGR
jgi:hypothetical protein